MQHSLLFKDKCGQVMLNEDSSNYGLIQVFFPIVN